MTRFSGSSCGKGSSLLASSAMTPSSIAIAPSQVRWRSSQGCSLAARNCLTMYSSVILPVDDGQRSAVQRATERFIVGRDHVMNAGDRMRHRFRIRALVVPALREPHRVGVNALARDAAGGGGDEKRRIETPAREDAERNVRHQLALHGAQERVTYCRGVAECRPAAGRRRGAPERAYLGSFAFRDEQ